MSNHAQPLLADRFAAKAASAIAQGTVKAPLVQHVQQRLKRARVFVLDDAAVDRFAEVIRTAPDLIAKHQEFARAPYDVIWVEFDFQRFWAAVTGRHADWTSDDRLAYLIDYGIAYTISAGTKENPAAGITVVPCRWRLHDPWSFEDQVKFVGRVQTSRMQLDAWLWGEAIITMEDKEERRALRDHNTPELLFLGMDEDRIPRAFHHALVGGASGDLRNIVGLLLLLNRPHLTTYVRDVPSRRSFVSGKLRPFFAHTVVTIPLDPRPALQHIGEPDEEGSRRRHEVRGHYCHDAHAREAHAAQRCDHAWEADQDHDDPDNHWICLKCAGRRWWRHAHERGDAGKGFVVKRYQVKG